MLSRREGVEKPMSKLGKSKDDVLTFGKRLTWGKMLSVGKGWGVDLRC